ncbi:hypothetical protein [Kordia sp.]|uniref:hypothetical protein n=1 Tax=Kordia sp. TaxID=1965332 RepID=UPI003D2D4213
MIKKDKKLLERIAHFKSELQKFKSGNLSEEEFSKLLSDEISHTKRNVIEMYEAELVRDQKEIEILKTIKYKILHNMQLNLEEKELILAIIR